MVMAMDRYRYHPAARAQLIADIAPCQMPIQRAIMDVASEG